MAREPSGAPGPVPHMTPDEFRALGRRAVDWIADYMERVAGLPVLARVKPGEVSARLPDHAPELGTGASWDPVFDDLENIILPGLTHWQSPSFFGFFPCNASGPGILGELLSAGLNVNGMLWATSPAATELETRVLDWLGEMIGLPEPFLSRGGAGGGCIQGTASESTLIAMLAAKKRTLPHLAPGAERDWVCYASTQAHSSVVKAAMIAGIAEGPEDTRHVRLIEPAADLALHPARLAGVMGHDLRHGRVPFYVCATVGTTSSTAVDRIDEVARAVDDVWSRAAKEVPSPWLHVDAAHSGAACVCPEFRWMLRGVEHADSVCFNPHKWLLTNFDCDCFWVRDRRALADALSVTPEYLRNAATEAGGVTDYRDWQIPLGRRFRALKLWLVIRHYGVEGLRAYIREHVRLAAVFEGLARADARFEVCAPRTVNLVCFRLRPLHAETPPDTDARNRALLERINASGRAYLTHTVLPGIRPPSEFDDELHAQLPGSSGLVRAPDGWTPPAPSAARYVLRMAIGGAATREEHVRDAWSLIGSCVDAAGGVR